MLITLIVVEVVLLVLYVAAQLVYDRWHRRRCVHTFEAFVETLEIDPP